ncbi:MAG TPA: UdgX family uracil-DNA binding protein [Micromonosporaceae bacterium]|nr:UdgX family uracil-DNA binding protein [Micromonosporaceae bacterium]
MASPFVPATSTIDELRAAAAGCRGCDLYKNATQTVFGAGPPDARVVLIGEQPGDIEDRRGLPFVGPAGKVLDRAIVDAGLDRAGAYVTNVVKHFKFKSTGPGKRRIHQTPERVEIEACRPWLDAEFSLLRPEIVVALGATAAKALIGPSFRVTRQRGEIMPWRDTRILATIHPSAVLRADDREEAYNGLVTDLTVAAAALQ